jgi:hypothetical protein
MSCRTHVAALPLSQADATAGSVPSRRGEAIVLGMKLKGTIRRNDMAGGHWVIETDQGETYQLVGAVDGCKDGMKAEVEGKVDKGAMGIGMTGPHFAVQAIKAL